MLALAPLGHGAGVRREMPASPWAGASRTVGLRLAPGRRQLL